MATNKINLPEGFALDQTFNLPKGFVLDNQFDPEGSDYDYESAMKAGLKPQPVEGDTVPHWPSRDPKTGLLLKGRKHHTWDLLEKGENTKDCALRELEEETGFKANTIEFLFSMYSAIGFSNEKISVSPVL